MQKRMADYLRQQPQQAALRHLSPETMKQFGELLKKQGINISPVQEKKFETVDIRQENVGRDSLAQSLKNHFEQCRKTERILVRNTNIRIRRLAVRRQKRLRHFTVMTI